MSNLKEATKRARRGLAWIVRNGHKYDLDLSRVNLDILDLEADRTCLLFQAAAPGTARSFAEVIDTLEDEDAFEDETADTWTLRRGFDLEDVEHPQDTVTYADLNQAWKQLITKLRTGPEVKAPAPVAQEAETVRDTARRLAAAIETVLVANKGRTGVAEFTAAAARLGDTHREQLALKVLPVRPQNPEALVNAIQAALVNSQHIVGVSTMLRAAEQMSEGTRRDLARQILAQFNTSTPVQAPVASQPAPQAYTVDRETLSGLADVLIGALTTAEAVQPQLNRLRPLVNSISESEWNILGPAILRRANQLQAARV